MGAIYTVVSLEPKSHLVKDKVDFTASFSSPTLAATAVAPIVKTRWQTFLTNTGTYIGSSIDRTALSSHITAYELDDLVLAGGPLGSPMYASTLTVGARISGGEDYPQEAAVCCSFHASTTDVLEEDPTGRPAARRRGRFFFGPLASASENGSDGMVRVKAALIASLVTQMGNLAGSPTDDVDMVVWSRKDGVLRTVVGGHVDNEFDTQRRRGMKPSARTTWSML